MLPLAGVRVIEMAGLAPAPVCGMMLADFGAKVVKVDKPNAPNMDSCGRGKQSIAVNLKEPAGISVVQRLAKNADVLLEPFRPGVMERLGLGPTELMRDNPRLIYARLTGFGQYGPMSMRAGHDINYLGLSGLLSFFGRKHEKPYAPVNFAADFAGGSLTCAFGILAALLSRHQTGRGQVVDASMVEGAAYIGSWLWKSQNMFVWGKGRGENMLDGGAGFYDVYLTKDNEYMTVGALEPQFFNILRETLGFSEEEFSQFEDSEKLRKKLTEIFVTKTQAEWTEIFKDKDACVGPVLPWQQAGAHEHNRARESFFQGPDGWEPAPAPKLSETPARVGSTENPHVGQHTEEVLGGIGYSKEDIDSLKKSGIIQQHIGAKL